MCRVIVTLRQQFTDSAGLTLQIRVLRFSLLMKSAPGADFINNR